MKKIIFAALGVAVAMLAIGGRIAGPYKLVLPPDGNPISAATADCQQRAAGLALLLTAAREDGSIAVVYRCERP